MRTADPQPSGESERHLDLSARDLAGFPPLEELVGFDSINLNGNAIATIPPEIGQLTGLTALHVAANALEALPPEIGKLRDLKILNVGYNQLTSLPTEIACLESLELLVLDGNQIQSLPAEIGRLHSLLELQIAGNGLRSLPDSLFKLHELQALDVGTSIPAGFMRSAGVSPANTRVGLGERTNAITELPAAVGQLRALEHLYLSGNSLGSLPPEIGALTALSDLDLSDNALEHLPREIGALTQLQFLNVTNNKLEDLPDEIGLLRNLEQLDLDQNRLRKLPPRFARLEQLGSLSLDENELDSLPDLGQLRDLYWLDLDNNMLSTLDPWIGKLFELRSLYISNNRLTEIPPQIGDLAELRTLDLSENSLTRLPREIVNLRPDVNLRLALNPWDEPLASVVEAGTAELFAYLRSLDDAEELYEAKVLLLGEGDVGKSSLRDALMNKPFIEDRSTTHGIEVRRLTVPHPERDAEISLNVWDFGGQPVYRITHQFFFTRRALYLVVWKPRKGVEETAVEPWCRRIKLRVGDEAGVLIVATHANERTAQLDYPTLQSKFGVMLAGHFEVDNADGTGVDELRDAIAVQAAELPQMGELWSKPWRAARDAVLARPEPQISWADFEEACAAEGLDADATHALATMLHELGHVVYYGDDEGLRDVMVLNAEWLTKAMSYVLEDRPTLDNGGLLDHVRLREIWGEHPDGSYDPKYYPYFIRLMEKFDVSYRVPDEAASLVGQLVPFERPAPPTVGDSAAADRMRTLSVTCRLDQPADGLLAWFTVRHHRFGVGKHWRRGVFLEKPSWGAHALLEQTDEAGQTFALTVTGPSPDGFFSVLREGLEYLITTRWDDLRYELLVPCSGIQEDGRACDSHFKFRHLVDYRERGRQTIECHECTNVINVAQLLTGFGQADLQSGAAEVERDMNNVARTLAANTNALDVLMSDTAEMKALLATSADQMRRLLKVVSTEVSDCPRLFTFVPVGKDPWSKILKPWESRHRLTLWCEHPDHEHPWTEATYTVKRPKEWMVRLAPYAAVVVRTLQMVVPVAGAVAGATAGGDLEKATKADLDLMKALVQALPQPDISDKRQGGLTKAEGAGLRAMRELLLELDPVRAFGDLRRRQTESGDFVWICPTHYPHYDPGLPILPG